MNIKELRQLTNMSQKEFAEYFNIPVRTLQDWEAEKRTPPQYVVELIKYKLEMEDLLMERRFEIRKNDREVGYKETSQIAEGCTLDQVQQEPEVVETFATEEEAINALNKYKSSITELSAPTGRYYRVTEYYVEMNMYDSDGDWVDGGEQLQFTEMPSLED